MRRVLDGLLSALPFIGLLAFWAAQVEMTLHMASALALFTLLIIAIRFRLLESEIGRLRRRLLHVEGKVQPTGDASLDEIRLLLADGKKLEAIRVYQNAKRLDLRAAVREIDRIAKELDV